MSKRCELFPININLCTQSTLYGIKERTISAGKDGMFNHVSNNTLIRSINMPNVIESSMTKVLLEDTF